MRQYIKQALENIARYGDTDVLPFPLERHIFFDRMKETGDLLEAIHADFASSLEDMPLDHEDVLTVVGYNGFRRATQIDPIWNVYLLALVLSLAEEIEGARVPTTRNVVYSYRLKPDPEENTLFDRDLGWVAFQQRSVELASNFSHVLVCDISDFYPRVYHHRLENALKKACKNTESIRRVMLLLLRLSKGVSYGLPVGGPAARLLAELVLNRVDRLLLAGNITFCRFVDDYHVFANSREEAHERLVLLCDKLLENEGLSLQKSKTQVMTSAEFLSTSDFSEQNAPETEDDQAARGFLSLHLHYDPYSETADEDYEALCDELDKFDIVGMLTREMQKSRIHQPITRKLVSAVAHLEHPVKNAAVASLLENFSVLYPIFPTVMILLRRVVQDLTPETQQKVFRSLRALIAEGSYIVRVPANLAFAIRVLAHDPSDETDEVFARVYDGSTSKIIRRDIILYMAGRDADYWVSDRRKQYSALPLWERRALLVASYILADEGAHWRDSLKGSISSMDKLVMDWAAEKKSSGNWSISL